MNKRIMFLLGLLGFCSYPIFGLALPSTIGFFLMLGSLWPKRREAEEGKKPKKIKGILIRPSPKAQELVREIALRRDEPLALVWAKLFSFGVLLEHIDWDSDSEVMIVKSEGERPLVWSDTADYRDFPIPPLFEFDE